MNPVEEMHLSYAQKHFQEAVTLLKQAFKEVNDYPNSFSVQARDKAKELSALWQLEVAKLPELIGPG